MYLDFFSIFFLTLFDNEYKLSQDAKMTGTKNMRWASAVRYNCKTNVALTIAQMRKVAKMAKAERCSIATIIRRGVDLLPNKK